jgi:hypothetical protein
MMRRLMPALLLTVGLAVVSATAASAAPAASISRSGRPAGTTAPAVSGHAITTVATLASTIDPHADTTGPVLVDSSGNGYVAWDHPPSNPADADDVFFCKIPRGGTCTTPIQLRLPAASDTYSIDQPFPVFGVEPDVVYVVGPRYDLSDTVIWTSHNGGASFAAAQEIPPMSFAGDTGVGDVLLDPDSNTTVGDYMDVASANPGLGYSLTGPKIIAEEGNGTSFTFDQPDGILASTLGDSGKELVEAYGTDAATETVDYFWAADNGSSSIGSPAAWSGPVKVTDGQNPRLAGGPDGLFLLSEDAAGNSEMLELRKWDASSHSFGAPTTVFKYASGVDATEQGGFTEDDATGALYVAWPNAAGVIQLWTSTDGGKAFAGPVQVGRYPGGYNGPARLAMTDGHGFLTWEDDGGLELVDLGQGAPPGYWLASADGQVFGTGGATVFGSLTTTSADPVVGIAHTADGGGYWEVTRDGEVKNLGDAGFYQDLPSLHVSASDVVAVAPTTDGRGYWLIGRDGGLFAFGDAKYHGSLPALGIHVDDVVGMVASPNGSGYLLVGSDGGVFAFGHGVGFYGSLPGLNIRVSDIVGILPAPTGTGYDLVGADGGVFAFGHGVHFYGSLPGEGITVDDVVGLALTNDTLGYWLAGANGTVYPFGDGETFSEPPGVTANLPVAGIAGT